MKEFIWDVYRHIVGVPRTNDGKHWLDVGSNGTTSLPSGAALAIARERFGQMRPDAISSEKPPAPEVTVE